MSHDPHADPDMLRVVPAPCVHYWIAAYHDENFLYCRHCRQTWALDDDPGDDAA